MSETGGNTGSVPQGTPQEEGVTRAIVDRYMRKLKDHLALDLAVVGGGPSGLVCAGRVAQAGKRVAVFERGLAPGGGVWGGGMLFNEVVVQEEARGLLDDYGIRTEDAGEGYYTADSVETSAALILFALRSGAVIFNGMSVEDTVMREGRVCGVVTNWAPVTARGMHVDPLVFTARAVLDGTGHPSEIANLVSRKAGMKLDTETGGVMGERPMWVEMGERATVESTKAVCPGLYVSGMAACNVSGGFRMGPIFGGMFLSGEKVAKLILEELG